MLSLGASCLVKPKMTKRSRIHLSAIVCLAIISYNISANSVALLGSILKETERDPNRPHPRAGARDENGTWGYVHDPTVLLRSHRIINLNSVDREQICDVSKPGLEGKAGHQALTKKIKVSPGNSTVRIFCAIYTYHGGVNRTDAIIDTWGRRCDGFMAASTYTHRESATVRLPHLGEEGNLFHIWQKLRSMYSYIHENFLLDYDYFHFCGDDVYLIVDNLREYLSDKDPDEPFFGGGIYFPMRQWGLEGMNATDPIANFFAGGGPGYTLSRGALDRFVREALSSCYPDRMRATEDLYITLCLRRIGIPLADTRDGLRKDRYHHYDPQQVGIEGQFKKMEKFYNYTRKSEHGAMISSQTVSFHMIKQPNHMRRIHRLLYPRNNFLCRDPIRL